MAFAADIGDPSGIIRLEQNACEWVYPRGSNVVECQPTAINGGPKGLFALFGAFAPGRLFLR
jgi:hypothetical protein